MQLRLSSPWLWIALVGAWLLLWISSWGAIVAFLFVAALGGWILLQPSIRGVRAWERLAQETGGEFVDGELWGDGAASFVAASPSAWKAWTLLTSPLRSNAVEWALAWPLGGGKMTLDTDSYPEREEGMAPLVKYTRLRAAFPNPDRFRFQVYAAGLAPQPGLVMQIATFGDPELDGDFSLRTTDAGKAQALSASPRLKYLMRAEAPSGFRVELQAGTSYLAYDQKGVVSDLQKLEALHALFVAALGRLAELGAQKAPALDADQVSVPTPSAAASEISATPVPRAPAAAPNVVLDPAPIVVHADAAGRAEVDAQPLDVADSTEERQQVEVQLTETLERVLQSKAAVDGERALLPTVGQTASNEKWELTLKAYGPYEQVVGQSPPGGSQGRLFVAEFAVKNLQRFTGSFTTSNFVLEDGRRRAFRPAGETTTVPQGFWLVWVQAGERAEHRVVFEIDAEATDLTLDLLGVRFRLPE